MKTRRDLLENYGVGGKPPKEAIKPYWQEEKVRDALYAMQNKKCAYCERVRNEFRETDVDHYRPKGAVEGQDRHPGYWWLAHDWRNLLGACKQCNSDFKRSNFPLSRQGRRAFKPTDPLEAEHPLLIDPTAPTEIDCIGWGKRLKKTEASHVWIGYAYPQPEHQSSDRAQASIMHYGLNDGTLLFERGKLIVPLSNMIQSYWYARIAETGLKEKPETRRLKALIKGELDPSQQFLGFRRWLVGDAEHELLRELLTND
jgi:uncharacterized protein (TIGR02646 family)